MPMTPPPALSLLDLQVIPPRPANGHGAGAGITMHLRLDGYQPGRKLRHPAVPLCGAPLPETERHPLDWLDLHQRSVWVWCKHCLGHLVVLLEIEPTIIERARQRGDDERLAAKVARHAEAHR